jgi:hypothetical protein
MLHDQVRVERDGRRGPVVDRPGVSTLVRVDVERDGRNGPEVVRRSIAHNTWVNTGKKNVMRLISGNTAKVYDQIRIGTSGAAVASNQTNVLAPVAATLTTWGSITLSGATRTYNWVHSYASGGGSKSATDIQEVCVLNQGTSPGGSALNRSTFTAVTKTTADRLTITYKARLT